MKNNIKSGLIPRATRRVRGGFIPRITKLSGGFTLIEILIVVAIIAILMGSVLIGFPQAQKQGRDARRLSDLHQVQVGLQLYYAKCGYYPGSAQAGSSCGSFSQLSSWSNMANAIIGSNIGVKQIPNDPSSGKTYFYGTDANGSGYVIGAAFEDQNNPVLQNSAKGDTLGINCNDNVYCIQF